MRQRPRYCRRVQLLRSCSVLVAAATLATSSARADSGDPFDPGTVALQFGGGVVGGAAGGAVLGAAFYGLAVATSDSRSYAPLFAGAFGIVLGGLGGALVTVKLVGDARDAEGGWAGASLGLLGGGLAAGAAQSIIGRQPTPLSLGVGAALLIGGPVIGYQLQNDGPAATTERRVMFSLPVAAF